MQRIGGAVHRARINDLLRKVNDSNEIEEILLRRLAEILRADGSDPRKYNHLTTL